MTRRASWRWWFLLTLWLLGSATGWARQELIATQGLSTTVLNRTHYLDAAEFLRRYGLEQQWQVPAQRATFSSVWTSVELESDKREIRFNGRRVFLGDGVALHRGQLWISRLDAEKLLAPLLRSRMFAATAREPKVIAIDAGHGGQDTGTSNRALGLQEKVFALDVAQRLAALLKTMGYTTMLTRSDDTFIPLEKRAEIANAARADLFISIHFNAAPPSVVGTETYILTPRYQRSTSSATADDTDQLEQSGNASDPWNAVLGYHVHDALLDRLSSFDRGLKRARWAVLKTLNCPGVLIESGYLSNDDEAKKIAQPAHRAAIAEAIANGIEAYSAQVGAARKR